MISRFGKPVSELAQQQIIHFYEILSQRLTEDIEEILKSENLRMGRLERAEQKVEQVVLLNTIVHETDVEMESMIADVVSKAQK